MPFPFRKPVRCTPRVELLEDRNLLTFYGGYRTIAELLADAAAIADNYPEITELVDYGDSYSKTVGGVTTPGGQFVAGYDLLALRITNRSIPGPKPVFFVIAGLHSREISTPEVGMRFADMLTQGYGQDADITWMVDHHEIWFVPSTNPDGHWYVELGTQPPYNGNPWLWRKNGRPNACQQWPPGRNGEAYGVDLNRNFDDHWGGPGSSNNPCSLTYRGTSVASEPETYALQDLIRTLIPDQRGPSDLDAAPDDASGIFIDMHTFGGYVLWPWGHTNTPAPNAAGLTSVGNKLASYNGYRAGQSFQTLYATTGTTKGWVYTELGAAAYTIELDSPGFLAPYTTVDGQLWPEVQGSLLYAARVARAPYMLSRGPDADYAVPYYDGEWVYIFAGLNDTQTGGQNLQAAEFYVDTPPWMEGAVAQPLIAVDGDFDGQYEDAAGYLFAADLTPGRHIVYVRGQDSAGNWGPVSALFVDIGAAPGRGSGSGLVEAIRPAATQTIVPATPAELPPLDGRSWEEVTRPPGNAEVALQAASAAPVPAVVDGLFAFEFFSWQP